jgi:hypothetical protein
MALNSLKTQSEVEKIGIYLQVRSNTSRIRFRRVRVEGDCAFKPSPALDDQRRERDPRDGVGTRGS